MALPMTTSLNFSQKQSNILTHTAVTVFAHIIDQSSTFTASLSKFHVDLSA